MYNIFHFPVLPIRNILFLVCFLGLFFTAPSAIHSSEPGNEPEFNIKDAENNEIDTILPSERIRQKLEDPDFDTRFNRGSKQPWHDRKSLYLRRTIPISQLALTHDKMYAYM